MADAIFFFKAIRQDNGVEDIGVQDTDDLPTLKFKAEGLLSGSQGFYKQIRCYAARTDVIALTELVGIMSKSGSTFTLTLTGSLSGRIIGVNKAGG